MNAILLLTTVGLGSVATLGMLIFTLLWKKKREEEMKKKLRPIRVRSKHNQYR